MRILVADDHRDTATVLEMILRGEGHEVRIAGDGIEVLKAVPEFSPEVIILDLSMPKLDGYDVCSTIRSRAGSPEVKIMALSGHTSPEDRQRSKDAGFDLHLGKPLDIQMLRDALRQVASDQRRNSSEGNP